MRPDDQRRSFLGITRGGWTKLVLGVLLTVITGTGAWALAARDQINTIEIKQAAHEGMPAHAGAAEDTREIRTRVRRMETEQAVQGTKLDTIINRLGR